MVNDKEIKVQKALGLVHKFTVHVEVTCKNGYREIKKYKVNTVTKEDAIDQACTFIKNLYKRPQKVEAITINVCYNDGGRAVISKTKNENWYETYFLPPKEIK